MKVKRLKANATGYEEYSVDERRSGGKSTGRGLEFREGAKVVALYVGDVKAGGDEHTEEFYQERARAILKAKKGEEPLKGWSRSETITQAVKKKEHDIEWKCFWPPVDFDYPRISKTKKMKKREKRRWKPMKNKSFRRHGKFMTKAFKFEYSTITRKCIIICIYLNCCQ